jgi:GT2 family glycosyltransferase
LTLSLVVVVLHYSNLDDTRECVDSLGRQDHDAMHVVVVDNGSAEPIDARFKQDFPWVEVLTLPDNRGWAGGNNAGINLARDRGCDWICLVNNDTVLPDHAAARLMQTAELLGPCMLHPAIDSYGLDDQPQFDPVIPFPIDMRADAVPDQPGLFQINAVSGACMLAPMALFAEIGLIDERFFLLFEDADLGKRAFDAGFRSFCETRVRIQHKESRSFGGRRKPIKTYYGVRNVLLYYEKNVPGWRSRLSMPRRIAWEVWRTAEAAGHPPRSWVRLAVWAMSRDAYARAIRMGLRDYALRRFGRLAERDAVRLNEP